jgi:hypothetical protein
MPYRNRETGQYPLSRAELLAAHRNTSFPAAWDAGVLDFLGADEVSPTPQPAAEPGFAFIEGAPELTEKGTWQQTWDLVEVEMPEPVPEPVPQIVSRFQARAAMLSSPATSADFPNLLAQIDAAVAASDNAFVQLAWAEAVEWNRASPTVNALAGAVGVTGEQLDDLFRAAAGIVA